MLSLRDLKKLDRDDLLDLVGLQRASTTDWVAPALTALGVGLLVGVGVGLLLAPKPGAELRNDLRDKLRSRARPRPAPCPEQRTRWGHRLAPSLPAVIPARAPSTGPAGVRRDIRLVRCGG